MACRWRKASACTGNLRKLKKFRLCEIFCFSPILPFSCKCQSDIIVQAGKAVIPSFRPFPSHFTSNFTMTVAHEKARGNPDYLLEVEHVGVVVVLHGDGGLHDDGSVFGGDRESGGLSQAGVCVQVPAAANDRSTTAAATSELLRRLLPPTGAFLLYPTPTCWCLLKYAQNESLASRPATHLLNWCQECFLLDRLLVVLWSQC